MKNYYLLLLYLILVSCDLSKSKELDKSKIAILSAGENSFFPTDDELLVAESLANNRIKIYNEEQKAFNIDMKYVFGDSLHYERKLIEFQNYYKQCEGFIDEKGEKIISFNCLCRIDSDDLLNWKKNIIVFKDGGNCYFQISVNIDKKIVFGFMINSSS